MTRPNADGWRWLACCAAMLLAWLAFLMGGLAYCDATAPAHAAHGGTP